MEESTNFWIWFLIAFVLFDLFVVIVIVLKRMKGGLSGRDKNYAVSNWARIKGMYKSDPKHAVIEADKLLDYVLKKRFKSEASVGQNLQKYSSFFSNLNGVWFAHKLRNKVAHELNCLPSKRDFEQSRMYFETALKDLGM